MELKPNYLSSEKDMPELLIVPYGIETRVVIVQELPALLLIVPYGIETLKTAVWWKRMITFNRTLWN